MSDAFRILMTPFEMLSPEDREMAVRGKRRRARRQKIIDDLLASAIKGELPWPNSHDA